MKLLIAIFIVTSVGTPAQAKNLDILPGLSENAQSGLSKSLFSTDLISTPEKRRNDIWPPLASFLLPGFDQWVEYQYPSALFYSGSAIGGLLLASPAAERLRASSPDLSNLETRDDDVRTVMLGSQIYMAMGSFSAYHSFRSAARSLKTDGRYDFLEQEETTGDILASPFDFSFLARPTTYLPLGGLLVLSYLELATDGEMFKNNSFRLSDAGFASGFSYLAGTNEEALFRGWMMPMLMDRWQSKFWSNLTQSALFAAAHISSHNERPLAQLLMGWYLGYLTQKNRWSVGESIFIHTWWDVIAFTATYLYESRDKRRSGVYLPLMSAEF